MDIKQTAIGLLLAERDRLNRAIEALTGSATGKPRGRPPKNPHWAGIKALDGLISVQDVQPAKRRGRPPGKTAKPKTLRATHSSESAPVVLTDADKIKPKRKVKVKRGMTAEQRQAQSERMKAMWASRR